MNLPAPAIEEALTQATAGAIENLAFREVRQPDDDDPGCPVYPALRAAIPILEPEEGRFVLDIPPALAAELTGIIHGLADAPDEALLNDTLAEVANTVAGRFMAAITPPGSAFRLGLPDVSTVNEGGPAGVAITLCIEEVCFHVQVDGPGFTG